MARVFERFVTDCDNECVNISTRVQSLAEPLAVARLANEAATVKMNERTAEVERAQAAHEEAEAARNALATAGTAIESEMERIQKELEERIARLQERCTARIQEKKTERDKLLIEFNKAKALADERSQKLEEVDGVLALAQVEVSESSAELQKVQSQRDDLERHRNDLSRRATVIRGNIARQAWNETSEIPPYELNMYLTSSASH